MSVNRRKFIKYCGLATISSQLPLLSVEAQPSPQAILKPPRLQVGDMVGLISPAGIIDAEDIEDAKKALAALGLKTKLGTHVLDRYGYLAGKDIDRAQDVNNMFRDKSVKAIIAMRGGWGCNRILHLLNYSQIRSNPKIILGYSDITSLLLAIYARSRVVTFHGAVATSTWNDFTVDYFKRVLFNGENVIMQNVNNNEGRREVISSGKAKGKLVGGNLSVLAAMIGSPYLPSWNRNILFLEDIGEDVYKVDRMLTQLKNAGVLARMSGFIFAQCTNCKPGDEPTFALMQVLSEHIKPLNIPAWYGSMVGHIKDKFTMPVGVDVEIDADMGTITMLEGAVS